jgi:hypothetical protein
MGHLVNPIAYRLGHTRSWEDNWFIKNIYYPEFLHSILKIRQYIHYFWTTRFMEKKGILLSHFYIYKFIKHLLVKTFLYNTDFEKYIYSFYARGVGIFSDSFYYRFKRKKKKKEPNCYERYKPDLFFLLFLYYGYFTKLKVKRRKQSRKGFWYLIRKYKKNKNINTTFNEDDFTSINKYFLKKRTNLNYEYLNKLKLGKINFFLKLPFKMTQEKKENLNISRYEEKIKLLTSKRINLGFLDFLVYIFFKINMLEKQKEDMIRNSKNRKHVEMVIDYKLKLERWIILIKRYIDIQIILGKKTRRKRSIRNFVFFLTFLLDIVRKVRGSSSRINFRLRELNLKLIRLFLFNRVLTEFAFFYGQFLTHILYLFMNMKNFKFKFCFITNNSVNAKFLTRYMGLKLKRKFPLFFVVNPLKKELRKLAKKKKEKKFNQLAELFNPKFNLNKIRFSYRESFINVVTHLWKKYSEILFSYYEKNKTLIMIDIYIFFLLLKKKYKYQSLLILLKKKFLQFFNENILIKKKKRKIINKKWVNFLFLLLEKKDISFFLKLKMLSGIYIYNKNKLLINLFFGFNKYSVDNLSYIFFELKGDLDTFFFFNNEYVFITIYSFFFNYNSLNLNTTFNISLNIMSASQHFFKTFMYYIYVQYGFNNLMNYIKLNKKNYYIKMKELYSSSSFILGYKMSFKGRFTRKQRASSVWFHQGFVPLNTVSGYIDYSFFTIPLKNSAVSIKLWLYKNTNKVIWDSKFLNKR